MIVQMIKFGTLLNSRPVGKEVALRIIQIVNGFANDKEIILDFANVEIVIPSFGDELLHQLKSRYGNTKKIKVENAETPTVKDIMKLVME